MSGKAYRLPSGRWQYRGRLPGGRPVKHTERTKAAAEAWGARQHTDAARGELVDLSNPVTVYDYCAGWCARRAVRPNTRHGYGVFLHHLRPAQLAGRPLVRVSPVEVADWAAGLSAAGLAPASVAKVVGIMRAACRSAVTGRVLARSPVLTDRDLGLPRIDREPVTPLTVAEVRRWAAAAPPRFRAAIIAQAGLGCRINELLALRTDDVDWLRRTVDINAQLSADGRERVALKTGNSRRTIPLPAHVAEALAAHLAEFGPGPGGLVFSVAGDWRGQPGVRPYRSRTAWKHYRDAAVAAGLGPDLGTHVLRHTYASQLLDAGYSVAAVAAMCGNTPQMIMSTYAHLVGDPRDGMRAALDAAWAAEPGDGAAGAR